MNDLIMYLLEYENRIMLISSLLIFIGMWGVCGGKASKVFLILPLFAYLILCVTIVINGLVKGF
jgi:hypothetical protein